MLVASSCYPAYITVRLKINVIKNNAHLALFNFLIKSLSIAPLIIFQICFLSVIGQNFSQDAI